MRSLSIRIIISLIITSGIVIAILLSEKPKPIHAISSPNGQTEVGFFIDKGKLTYTLIYQKDTVISNATFSIDFWKGKSFKNKFKILGINDTTINETSPANGDTVSFTDNYKDIVVRLQENARKSRLMNIHMKIYNEGIAYCYEFPDQVNLRNFQLKNETARFMIKTSYLNWWSSKKSNETYKVPAIDHAEEKESITSVSGLTFPIICKTSKGTYMAFVNSGSAPSSDLATANLGSSENGYSLTNNFFNRDTSFVIKTPARTPWHIILFTKNLGAALNSSIDINLHKKEIKKDKVAYDLSASLISLWNTNKTTFESALSNTDSLKNETLKILLYGSQKKDTSVIVFSEKLKTPVNWDKTLVLEAEMREYLTIARKSADIWYIASINNKESRVLILPLTFLDKDKNYSAFIQSEDQYLKPATITSDSVLKIKISEGAGAAIKISPYKNF